MLVAAFFLFSFIVDASRSKKAVDYANEGHIVAAPLKATNGGHIVASPQTAANEEAFLSIRSKDLFAASDLKDEPPAEVAVEGEDTKLVKGRMCMWGSLVFFVGLQWTWHSQLKSSHAQILNRLIGCLIPLGVIVYFMFWTGLMKKIVKGEEIDMWCTMLCIWALVQVFCGLYLLVLTITGQKSHEQIQREDSEEKAKAEFMALPWVHREAIIQQIPQGQWAELTWTEKLGLLKKRLPLLLKEERERRRAQPN